MADIESRDRPYAQPVSRSRSQPASLAHVASGLPSPSASSPMAGPSSAVEPRGMVNPFTQPPLPTSRAGTSTKVERDHVDRRAMLTLLHSLLPTAARAAVARPGRSAARPLPAPTGPPRRAARATPKRPKRSARTRSGPPSLESLAWTAFVQIMCPSWTASARTMRPSLASSRPRRGLATVLDTEAAAPRGAARSHSPALCSLCHLGLSYCLSPGPLLSVVHNPCCIYVSYRVH
jgi:hypothetical protein